MTKQIKLPYRLLIDDIELWFLPTKYLVFLNFTTKKIEIYYLNSSLNLFKLKQGKNPDGYITVTINKKHTALHRVIAEIYLGKRPEGLVVNHKDGNKLNNFPENLEYCTVNDNIQHSIKMGFHVCNDPKRSGRYKHGKAIKELVPQYKKEHYLNNLEHYTEYKRRWYLNNKQKKLENKSSD